MTAFGTPVTDEEFAANLLASLAVADAGRAVAADLAESLALADLYPAPTPEETAIIDAQVTAALAGFRTMPNPPADVVALAAAVVSWRTEV